jgi:hypothetical protein
LISTPFVVTFALNVEYKFAKFAEWTLSGRRATPRRVYLHSVPGVREGDFDGPFQLGRDRHRMSQPDPENDFQLPHRKTPFLGLKLRGISPDYGGVAQTYPSADGFVCASSIWHFAISASSQLATLLGLLFHLQVAILHEHAIASSASWALVNYPRLHRRVTKGKRADALRRGGP